MLVEVFNRFFNKSIEAELIEVPPHYRTIKINKCHHYTFIPYTQFYFTKEKYEYGGEILPTTLITNTKESFTKEIPKQSIFSNCDFDMTGYDFPKICWGYVQIDDTSPKSLINQFWLSAFDGDWSSTDKIGCKFYINTNRYSHIDDFTLSAMAEMHNFQTFVDIK